MTDTNHTDRSNLGQIEKKFDPLSTETQHTDSVEALSKEVLNRIATIPQRDFNGMAYVPTDELVYELKEALHILITTLQAHTSQQVEEAVKAERLKVISEIEAEVNTLFVFGRQVGIGGLYTTAAMRGPNEEVASWVKKEDVLVCIDKAKPLSTPNHQD